MNPLYLALLFAILSPIIFAFMNILDKFVMSKKVKKPLGFVVVAGIVNLLFGIILALFLTWNSISFNDLIFPLISGTLFGSQFYLYYYVMKKEDASNLAGLIYFYPILVAIFSFLFLNEKLSFMGYLGMLFITFGALMLSIKIHKFSGKSVLFMISLIIVITSVYEFLVKVITNNISKWNGVSLEFIFIGISILCGLFFSRVRSDFKSEIKNLKWAFLTETFTFMGISTTFLAMAGLKATIVSSIASIQPLVVLFFENTTSNLFGKIHREHWKSKIVPIVLIVIGIIILYSFEVI